MEEDQRNREKSRNIIRPRSLFWICICLVLASSVKPAASESLHADDAYAYGAEDSRLSVTQKPGPLLSSSERTSNAILEAEEGTSETLKKYGTKKAESASVSDQLEKPYPYYKAQGPGYNGKKASVAAAAVDQLDNDIQQSKRSGDLGDLVASVNASVTVSVTESEMPETTTETESTTSAATESTTVTTASTTATSTITTTTTTTTSTSTTATSMTTVSEETSTLEEGLESDWSTTPTETTVTSTASDTTSEATSLNTQRTTTNPPSSTAESVTVSNDVFTTDTENPPTTVQVVTTTTQSVSTPTTVSTTAQPEESSTGLADVITTSTELTTTTTLQDETSTTIVEEEQTTVTTAVTDASTTTTTTTTTAAATTESTTELPTTPKLPVLSTTESPTTETTSVLFTTSPSTTKTTPVISTTESPTTESPTTATTLATTPEIISTALPTVVTVATPEPTTSTLTSTMTTTVRSTTPTRGAKTTLTTTSSESSVSIWADESTESTTEVIAPTMSTDDVTLLIRIVFEGNWKDVCKKLPLLRQSLTDLINNNVEKKISPDQIIFHQTQCSDNLTPTTSISEMPLTSVLVYVVDENGNFDATLTKILPNLYEMSPFDFPLTIHSFSLVQEADTGNAIAVVIVSCVAFICLILLAGLLFIMRKRQGRFNYGERCRPVSLDAYSLDSVSAYNSVRRSKGTLRFSKRSYGNPTFEDSSAIPTHPLNFAGLATFCNDTNAISEEFANIPQVSSKIDELPAGAELKNRYANVIPLPETRVPLQRLNNDPNSEYINASYVRGPKNANKYYVACQAPTEGTVSDFWRMIWEQQCKVIIMLTDLVENGVEKCTEYIPPLEVSDCHRLYGDYQVTLKKREAKEKYAISTLHLKNLENNTFREVSHIWYLWPVNGVPTDAAGLIAVLLEARALQRGAAGPIVVHCSPGTGRTGTLIALDLCIRQYEITRTVDVPRVVYTIRRDRAGAVQTREQYAFVYKGLNLYASKLAGGAIEST